VSPIGVSGSGWWSWYRSIRSVRSRCRLSSHVVGSRPLAFLVDHHPELRREHGLLAAAVEGEAEKLFALRSAIGVGRVDEVDPQVESGIDDRARCFQVDPAAEVVAAEPDRRDLE
jgi:hypothetical protein